jgi:hypothetical protein
MVKETSVFLNLQEERTSKEEGGMLECNVFGTIQHKAVENNTQISAKKLRKTRGNT